MVEFYDKLADALDRLPNGFPRTDSGIEIKILQHIFSKQEAKIASSLTKDFESIEIIAKKNGLELEEAKTLFNQMANKGLLWSNIENNEPHYRLAAFAYGIYEWSLHLMDHSFAHMIEEYFHEGGVEGIMKPLPSIHRIVPAQGAVKSEWILPYDDVRQLIESKKVFNVRDCICRVQRDLVGKGCDFPVHNCMNFSDYERPPRPGDITKDEALALLDESEKIGLVHSVSNVIKGLDYLCNCCGCCCGIIRGLTEFGYETSIAVANYFAVIDSEACIGCGICEKRCHVTAINMTDGKAVLDLEKCIGCGLCVSGCSVNAAKLFLKPEEERIDPPEDFGVWEKKRLENRGMI